MTDNKQFSNEEMFLAESVADYIERHDDLNKLSVGALLQFRKEMLCDRSENQEYQCSKEHFKFKTPEQCVNCQSMMPFGDNYFCHMEAISPDIQDISTIFVDPESRPDWCPMIRLNDKIKDMTPKQRETIDTLAMGLSELFGI